MSTPLHAGASTVVLWLATTTNGNACWRNSFACRQTWRRPPCPHLVDPVLSIPLTMQQLKVVFILTTDPDGSTIQALSKTLGVSLATMSGIVDRLESQQMVHRVDDLVDHRVRRVLATAKGREVVQELLAARPQLSRQPLEQLDLDDLRALSQGLSALLRVMRSAPETPPPGS